MEKKKDIAMKRRFRTLLASAWMLLAVAGPCLAEEKKAIPSPAEAIAEAARQVSEDSKAAYHGTRDAVAKSSKEAVEGAKKAFQEARGAGTQAVEGVKKGLNKEPASEP